MYESQAEIRELRRLLEDLLARVARLEERAGVAGNGAAARQSEQDETGPARLEVVPPQGTTVKTPRTPTRRSDLEARIGSQWLNRIGIIALLIGLSYFLKYAFENNWIGPALYFAWYAEFYSARQFGLTFAFATLFFAIFAMATLAGSGRVSIVPRSVLMVAALNGVVYFLQIYMMLESATARAWFAAVLAIVYMLLARQGRGQARLQGTHLALAIGFITVAIALRLQEVWISLGWFVEAALLMAAGFWRGSAFVRWLALGLIAATIAKVFAYDIWDLSRGYRILSFVFLGVLLLAVSFAYQRDWLKLARGKVVQG